MSKKGGYVIVDLKGQSITAGTPFTLDGVTARLNRAKTKACLLSGFAIGDEEKRDVFVDLQKTDDGYIALFGQYTMTIEDDEVTITNGGVLMDNIVDSQGHKRYAEGTLNVVNQNIDVTYNKWSLSGTHLMMVLAFKIPSGASITGALAQFETPEWIISKIKPIASALVTPSTNFATVTASGVSASSMNVYVSKQNDVIRLTAISTYSQENDTYIRVQFDFLIDSDAE